MTKRTYNQDELRERLFCCDEHSGFFALPHAPASTRETLAVQCGCVTGLWPSRRRPARSSSCSATSKRCSHGGGDPRSYATATIASSPGSWGTPGSTSGTTSPASFRDDDVSARVATWCCTRGGVVLRAWPWRGAAPSLTYNQTSLSRLCSSVPAVLVHNAAACRLEATAVLPRVVLVQVPGAVASRPARVVADVRVYVQVAVEADAVADRVARLLGFAAVPLGVALQRGQRLVGQRRVVVLAHVVDDLQVPLAHRRCRAVEPGLVGRSAGRVVADRRVQLPLPWLP
jgi:hypothetical protein